MSASSTPPCGLKSLAKSLPSPGRELNEFEPHSCVQRRTTRGSGRNRDYTELRRDRETVRRENELRHTSSPNENTAIVGNEM